MKTGFITLAISLVLAGVLTTLTFRFFVKRGRMRHIILADEARPSWVTWLLLTKHLRGREGDDHPLRRQAP